MIQRDMKNGIVAIFFLLTVASCLPKKKTDVEPDLAGTYQVSQLISGSTKINLPDGNGTSATAVVSHPSDSRIEVIVNLTKNGSTSANDFGTLTTRKANGRDYDVLDPTTSARIGSINGTDFTLDYTVNGQRFALISRK
ncbi:hypothetical protein [Spirosoma flavum]|uniref:Lipocalin-like domain-containing protein n=1 Tax=Spirosoma flavum TaxID=2048557 RepID=A0ABW6AS22_9BACT